MFQDGQRLGEFEILGRLGQGGMGAVYKARQVSLNRFVALKTLQASLSSDPEFIARFRREAMAAASLNHPNLVQVHSAGETDGLHWFAMEYVEGESAQSRVKRKERLDPAEALAIAIHVATALEYGWRKAQLIHRDIKPDNIFLSSDGEVKLGDLGLAKSAGSENQSLTMTGASMGTPHYVSPEQAQGKKDVDLRADIYSLGCTLFHLLSGKPPYAGDTAIAVMMMHVSSPVANLRMALPGCPEPLARAVTKMMAKQPASRQQNYADVIADLRRAYDALTSATVLQVVAVTQEPAGEMRKAESGDRIAGNAAPQPAGPPNSKSKTQNSKFSPALIAALTVIVAILGIAAFFIFGEKKPQLSEAERADLARAAKPAAVTPSPTPPDPKLPETVIDLLALVDPERDAVVGKWKRDGTALISDQSEQARLQIPHQPPAEYDFKIVFSRLGGVHDISQILVGQGQAFSWKMGGAGNSGFGFDLIGGKYAEQGNPTLVRRANGILPGRRYESVVKVRKNGFEAFLDGERITGWKTDYSDVSLRSGYTLRNPSLLGIGSWSSPSRFEKAELIPISGSGRPSVSPVVETFADSPAAATKDAPFENSLGMKFVPVPIGGGPTKGERVLFGVWLTRVQDYAAYAAAQESAGKTVDGAWKTPHKDGVPVGREADHPVVGVNWEEAQAFCQWLTAKETAEGKLPPGMRYRLPSDEEWSWAVGLPPEPGATPEEKAGKNREDFPWGKDFPPAKKVGNYADETFHAKFPPKKNEKDGKMENELWMQGYTDGFATTSPVGSFPANAYGLYDMGGNVWQWCEDWWNAEHKDRVLRGASWSSLERGHLRSSGRGNGAPGLLYNRNGFRCVVGVSAR